MRYESLRGAILVLIVLATIRSINGINFCDTRLKFVFLRSLARSGCSLLKEADSKAYDEMFEMAVVSSIRTLDQKLPFRRSLFRLSKV